MKLKDVQEQLGSFYKERGWSDYGPFIRVGFLMEEAGELAQAVRSLEIGRDRPDEEEKDPVYLKNHVKEELGDILANVILMANIYDLSLEEIVAAHKAKLEKRFEVSSK